MPTINKPKKYNADSGNRYVSDRRRIYNSERWRRLRAIKFADQPLCEMCQAKGIIRVAEDIHHIKSFMTAETKQEMYKLAYEYDNLMSLCKQCHQSIHNKLSGR